MTGEHLLLIIALTSAMTVVTSWRRDDVSWSLVNGAFLIATAIGYWVDANRAGLWLVGPYLLFGLVPVLLLVAFNRMLAARRYRVGRVLARIAYVLHPSRSHRNLVRLGRVVQLAEHGDVDAAAAILRETGQGGDLELEMLRLDNRWGDIIARIDQATPSSLDHDAAVLYIRALGETGQLDRLLDLYFDALERWAKHDDRSEQLASLRLVVAAFLGQPAIVDDICAGQLRHHDSSVKQYWRAVAHDTGGDRERARAIWSELAKDHELHMRTAAEHWMANPPVRIDVLPPALGALVAQLAADVRDAATYSGAHAHATRPVLAYSIAGVLIATHAYVSWRVQSDSTAIYDLGLFWSSAVLEHGEQWRIVTAMFLHAGWMHLAMNVLGLLWFGPFVERFVGRVRFAAIYLVGGMSGFALLVALDAFGWRDATAALGASGAVMAVIGASTAFFLRGSMRSPVAAARLRDMLVFVGLQVVFDIVAPRVSMTAHLTGLVIGFAFGLVSAPRK